MKELKRSNGKKFSQSDSIDFLTAEYAQCFEHMRHYDNLQNSMISFGLTGYMAIFAATYTIYQISIDEPVKHLFLSIILLFSSLAGIILLKAFVRNRVYFAIVSRQINTLRNYFMNNSELDFILYNKCYLDSDMPKNFNPKSTYMFYVYLLSMLNSVLLGTNILVLCFHIIQWVFQTSILISIIITLIALVTQLWVVFVHLSNKDNQTADEAGWGICKEDRERKGIQC